MPSDWRAALTWIPASNSCLNALTPFGNFFNDDGLFTKRLVLPAIPADIISKKATPPALVAAFSLTSAIKTGLLKAAMKTLGLCQSTPAFSNSERTSPTYSITNEATPAFNLRPHTAPVPAPAAMPGPRPAEPAKAPARVVAPTVLGASVK